MICFQCGSETFTPRHDVPVKQEFRGEELSVPADVHECTQCGWQALADDDAFALVARTADAYREKHGLLTSGEIKALRKQLDLSQAEFAARLQVGVASIKRWETHHVQDASKDLLMRHAMADGRVERCALKSWLGGSAFEVTYVMKTESWAEATAPVPTGILPGDFDYGSWEISSSSTEDNATLEESTYARPVAA